MASVLVLAAAPKRRFATPNARIMIHQPSIHGDFVAPAVDLDIQAREILRTRDRLVQFYAEATGQSPDKIKLALDRDKWFTAQEAVDFGLIDRIVASHKEVFSV
jgi:ATP-dependent Clp protease protease subunit